MGGADYRRNLAIAAGAVAAILFAVFDVDQWAQAYASDNFHNDLTFYYAAAQVGLSHGWQSIYDLRLQQEALNALGSGIQIAELARYISPPPVAWLAIPLTLLPFQVAYFVWSALLLVALGWTWCLASPGTGRVRLIHLAAAIGWLPVIYGLQLGQPGLFVALGVAGCYVLLRRGRPFWAGVALGALVLKPQLAFLVPPALLLSGRYRAFWGSVVAIGALAVLAALVVGPEGISAYQQRLAFAAGVPVNRELTIAGLIGNMPVARVVQALLALWALVLAYRLRGRGHEWAIIPALIGGLVASPYLHLDDLVMLGLAGWLLLRMSPRPGWSWIGVMALAIAAEGIPFWGPLPVIAGEIAALLLLSLMPRHEAQASASVAA
ncbi:MAG TPA: glycosyltransferase family 87 protein [Candidatus Micrarchaeaceae archaeon]|nr:glycosyltransferase family 87 protein [Candidatus Micrarchaeaceae archaeon]